MHVGTAFAHFLAGRHDEATAWANRALREQPNYPAANRILAASNALAGHMNEAQEAMAHLRDLDPSLRVSNLAEVLPLRRPEDLAKFAEGLRKAGAPRVRVCFWPPAKFPRASPRSVQRGTAD